MGQNCLGNFGRGPYEEHLCEIMFELVLAAQILFGDISVSSSGGHFLVELNCMGIFW